ncbi:MAG: SH3 domain-containing protein [Imperialibacter sp.]|uniref:SH3 domain-containing protein n=1 Tax=Imperialibacter sp. TaxID=2038411 RepID=UPI003A83BD8B
MKKIAFFFLSTFLLGACSQTEKTSASDEATVEGVASSDESEAGAQPLAAVCVWDNLSVRAEPNSKSKYITSISIGETLTLLGESAVDSADNNRAYAKVSLADGKEGWAQSLLVIEGGTAAVFTDDVSIYKRPDLLTKSDKSFSQMDIVAIKSLQDDWAEVVGKRNEGTWIETGWVKKENLSPKPVDIAAAKFGRIALNEKDMEKRKQAISDIINNPDFSGSTFIPRLEGELEGMDIDPLAEPADSASTQQ